MTKHAWRTPAQMALFATQVVRPRWDALPERVRQEIVSLLARLLMEHLTRRPEPKRSDEIKGGELR